MTETEWEQLHPDLAAEMVTAWENREKRIDHRNALIRHTFATAMGVKRNGRPVTVNDFLPAYCKPKRKLQTDEEIELIFASFASHQNG